MIGFERVAHAEQRAEPGARENFEYWHNGEPRYSSVNLLNILLVAAGGAIGSAARYLLSPLVLRLSGSLFPFGTFAVNLIGCIVFGLIAGAAEQRVPLAPASRAFLLVGVLGGFTTFSSYAFESYCVAPRRAVRRGLGQRRRTGHGRPRGSGDRFRARPMTR